MPDPGQFAYTPPQQPNAYGPVTTSDNTVDSGPQQDENDSKATDQIVQQQED